MALFRSAIGRCSACQRGSRRPALPPPPPSQQQAWSSIHREKRMKLYSELLTSHNGVCRPCNFGGKYFLRFMSTMDHPEVSSKQEEISIAYPEVQQPQRIKFKRPDKTAKHIMNEEVDKVQAEREIPDIRPGYIIQLKVILTQH